MNSKNETQTDNKDYEAPQFIQIKELGLLKYEAEEKREQSLITQASQMQTSFSFVTVAILMILPIIISNCTTLPMKFFFISACFILFFQFLSLVFASLSQWRWKINLFPDIDIISSIILSDVNWQNYSKKSYCIKQYLSLLDEVIKSKEKINKRRVMLIMISMICFYCSIFCILVSFIYSILYEF